ncbi:GNAT family N-acetyltransferase [Stakelama saccharophila]|uniref:GNAT family N-acetyltransferase n=1 Tax=Stakelama saccharophila TaxID=3075605 RepID=A0ABZ0BCC6_9SPHN|nr:GNAT family N-acetyltransferase [Stakelama sp. W311]WNO54934.1 GNAT family N-acetyltransferase [Stakelama sp. W311]
MFMRTPRLTLRPGWAEDADELAVAIAHRKVVHNLGRAPWPYALGDARAFIEAQQAERHGASFLICSHEDGACPIVGGIGFGPYENRPNELGYWITPRAWGRGYATEAGHAAIAVARMLGVAELTAGHHVDNPASGAVLRKLGFASSGSARRYSRGRGAWVDCTEYVLPLASRRNAADSAVATSSRLLAA